MCPSKTALRAVGRLSSIKCVELQTCFRDQPRPSRTCRAAEQMATHGDSETSHAARHRKKLLISRRWQCLLYGLLYGSVYKQLPLSGVLQMHTRYFIRSTLCACTPASQQHKNATNTSLPRCDLLCYCARRMERATETLSGEQL
jgi:hypothetical protein